MAGALRSSVPRLVAGMLRFSMPSLVAGSLRSSLPRLVAGCASILCAASSGRGTSIHVVVISGLLEHVLGLGQYILL